MPLYRYEAVDRKGRKLKATVEAADYDAVKAELRTRGLTPLSIEAGERGRRGLGLGRVTQKDLLTFTQELGSLLEAGLPIDKALYTLSVHTEKEAFRSILREVYIDLQRGLALSQALEKHRVFPQIYVNMVKAGEAGGFLEVVMKRLAAFLETSTSFREEIVSALIYPILLTFVSGLAVAVLMIYVVPRFTVIFEDMGQALPAPTQLLMDISHAFVAYWWAGAIAIVAIGLLSRTYFRTTEGRLAWDAFKLRVPMVRELTMKFVIARFSRTFGTLLQSGVPILEAARISREVAGNTAVSERLKGIEEGVSRGKGLYAPISESGVFPPVVTQMIAVGEEAGRLEETFILIAGRYESESRALVKRVVSVIEPALILVMGGVVGFIVISMLVAVFSINEIPI